MPCLAPWHAHPVIPVPYILSRLSRARLVHIFLHLQTAACSNQPRHDVGLQLPLRGAQAGQWAGERGPKMTRCSSRLLEHSRKQQALPRWASCCLCQKLYSFLFAQVSHTSLFIRWQHLHAHASIFSVLTPAALCYDPLLRPAGFCLSRQTCKNQDQRAPKPAAQDILHTTLPSTSCVASNRQYCISMTRQTSSEVRQPKSGPPTECSRPDRLASLQGSTCAVRLALGGGGAAVPPAVDLSCRPTCTGCPPLPASPAPAAGWRRCSQANPSWGRCSHPAS